MEGVTNREDRAYCAGLFEGEGHIATRIYKANGSGRQGVNNYKRSINIRINMTDEFPLGLFQDMLDVGSIYGPYHRLNPNHASIYTLDVSGFEKVQYVVAALWDLLSPKRQQQCAKALKTFLDWEYKHAVIHRRDREA